MHPEGNAMAARTRKVAPESDPDNRYIYVVRPRCPRCGSAELRVYKTLSPSPR